MPTSLRDTAIARARDLPTLLAGFRAVAPDLAQSLTAKPLLLAKSPPVVVVAMALSWGSTRWGLGWDDSTCLLVACVVTLAASYAMRAITRQPIAGIVRVPEPVVTAETVSPGIPVVAIGDKP